ncbi:MAG: hypothetical protein Q9167_006377 [Letrouitia subvulpina]
MASVRPVAGALMDFPEKFVDEALGFTVGIMYWLVVEVRSNVRLLTISTRLANCMSMIALTIASVNFTQFWDSSLTIAVATFIMLLVLFLMNACGVRIYGNLEWGFKWCKILLLTGLCILMIAIKAGVGPGRVDSKYEISPGFNSTGFFKSTDSASFDPASVAIPGTGGRFLAVWTSATLAMFQFLGGDIVLVTAGEAKRPRRDLPTAARYINTALYVSSRTLFVIARKSKYKKIRSTLGRTNNGNTPLAAIFVSFLPGLLAFLAIKSNVTSFEEPIHVIGRLYTGPMLCIYGSECATFLRFIRAMNFFKDIINRDSDLYKQNHYRGHWQPLWAILGLVLCSLLMIFSGWSPIFDLVRGSKDVKREDSIVDLIASYLGVGHAITFETSSILTSH